MDDHLTEARSEGALEFRRRCAAIMRSEVAKGRFKQARTLALDTHMTVVEAITVLSTAPLDADVGDAPGMGITSAMAADAWAKAIANIQ